MKDVRFHDAFSLLRLTLLIFVVFVFVADVCIQEWVCNNGHAKMSYFVSVRMQERNETSGCEGFLGVAALR